MPGVILQKLVRPWVGREERKRKAWGARGRGEVGRHGVGRQMDGSVREEKAGSRAGVWSQRIRKMMRRMWRFLCSKASCVAEAAETAATAA